MSSRPHVRQMAQLFGAGGAAALIAGLLAVVHTPPTPIPAASAATAVPLVPVQVKALSSSPASTKAGSKFPTPLVAEVIDGSGKPMANTLVTFVLPAVGPSATFASGGRVAEVPTNGSGVAVSPLLTAGPAGGQFTAQASAGAAQPAEFVLDDSGGQQATATHSASIEASPQVAIATGSISGTVTAANGGAGISGICVNVDFTDGSSASSTTTGTGGAYTVSNLAAGTYAVSFSSCGTGSYVTEWYDNVFSQSAATPVSVTAGGTIANINASMLPGATISGTVTDTSSPANDLSNICVDAYLGETLVGSVTTVSGAYSLTDLPPGSYAIEFDPCQGQPYVAQWYTNEPIQSLADPVTVSTGGSATANAALASGGEITGTVTDSNGAGLPGVCVTAYGWSSPYDRIGSTSTASGGSYTIQGLPSGSYALDFTGQCGAGNYLDQWYNGQSSQTSSTPVTVTAGNSTTVSTVAMAAGGQITGTVTDTASPPNPLSGICVSAFQGNTPIGFTQTGSSGTYTISGVPTGSYTVQFTGCLSANASQPPNYVTQWWNDQSSQSTATTVAVTAGAAATTGIDAAMVAGGQITGTVTDSSTGNPISGISVTVWSGSTFVASSYTGADGTYTVSGLASGDYTVEFNSYSGAYATQWWNDQPSQSKATTVAVTAGGTTGSVSAAMVSSSNSTTTGQISGTVKDSSGNPIDGLCVQAFGATFGYTQSDPSGNYVIPGLASGTYTVVFQDCQNPADYAQQQVSSINVTAGSTAANIDATVAQGGRITGTIKDTSGNFLDGLAVLTSQTSSGLFFLPNATSDVSGIYGIEGLPVGSYDVEFEASPAEAPGFGNWIPQWYNGQAQQTNATLVSVAAGGTHSGVDASMSPGGQITGTVTAAVGGSPLGGICILAEPIGGGQPGNAVTAADGTYDVAGLPTGSYYVRFTSSCGSSPYYATQFYDNVSSGGTPNAVDVTEGKTTSGIDDALQPAGAISGAITDSSGQVAPDVCVNVFPAGTTTGALTACSDQNGDYTVPGLVAGSYDVEFFSPSNIYSTQWYNGASAQSAATSVTVTSGAINSGIDAIMTTGSTGSTTTTTVAPTTTTTTVVPTTTTSVAPTTTTTAPPTTTTTTTVPSSTGTAPPPPGTTSTNTAPLQTATTSSSGPSTLSGGSNGATADVTVPAGALPSGTTVTEYAVNTAAFTPPTSTQSYVIGFAVSWQAPDGTSPTATTPVTMTITDPSIQAGDVVYMVGPNGSLEQVGTATQNGQVIITFTTDPAFLVATPPAPLPGYRVVAADGGVFSFKEPFYGSMGGRHLDQPIVGMADAPGGDGYYLVAGDGGVFTFGSGAVFQGSTGGMSLAEPVVGMAVDPATGGYWLVAADGGVFSFDAPFYGSMGGHHLDQPIVGMAAAPGGDGYYLVAKDGGVFAFGPGAGFQGSTGGMSLAEPVVGMAVDPATGGYWLVAADGGVFSFDAPFEGSTGGSRLAEPVVGMAVDPGTGGYWLVAADGGVFSFDAPFEGSTGGSRLAEPVVGMSGQ